MQRGRALESAAAEASERPAQNGTEMEAPRVSRADTEAVVFALKEERTRAIADQQAAQAATERAIAARKAAEAEVARLGRELTLLEQEPATEGRQLVITPGTTAELDPGPAQAAAPAALS